MGKRILFMLLIVAPVFSIDAWSQTRGAQHEQQPAKYLHDVWTTENGLPQNDAKQLIQTRDGYLWVGTYGGLVRFDGIRFTVFDTGNTPELRSNRIVALAEDRDGTLWIGTQNGGLTSYSRGEFKTYTTKDGLPDESVFDIEADPQGNVWLSPGGLLRLTDGHFTLYTTRDGLPSNGTGDLCGAPDGSIWFRSGGFIMHFHDGRFDRYGIKDLPGDWNFKVSSMTVARDGSVWLSTGYGLVTLQNGSFTVITPNRNSNAPVMPGIVVVQIYKDRAGNLRLLTPSGLAHYEDGKVILDTPIPALSRLNIGLWTVRSVMEDREGNLWVGTGGMGLHRFRLRQVTAYTAETGLSDQGFVPVTGDGAGGLWLGSTDSITSLYHFQDGKFTPFNVNAQVRSLYLDHMGTLWIGTDKGLYQLRDGRLITDHPLNPELRETIVQAIWEDRAGNLWVGTGTDEKQNGALYRLNEVTTKYQTSEGLVANDVRFIMEDRQGALWVGTTRGMSRFKDERFINYTTEQGLSNNFVREIHEDADGTLWIGTYGGGLNRFKDGHFTSITTRNGLFDNIVSRILEDNHDNFWMSGNRGIYRASRKELNDFADGRIPSVTSISYGVEDGMKINETNGGAQPAGWRTPDGKLWFPTIRGIVAIDPSNLNPLSPPVYVEQVLIGKTPANLLHPIEVRPGQGDLEIHYTGLSFVAPEKMRFKYKLDGYDRDWVDARERRVAYYTNISPGSYTFRVMASNNDGVWSTQDATIRIVVIPPFWRTWWFVSLVLLSLIAVVVVAYRRRILKLERANLAQQAFSRQLIESQENERKRIAAELHDSLGQQLLVIKNRALLALHTSESHEEAVGELNEISDATSQALDEVREIAYNLRPFQLDQLGLTKALESMLKKVSHTSGIDFSIMIDTLDGLYSKEAEINIYRIVQESANNIVRHSEATRAEVEITRDGRGVTIKIHDNGKGFAIDSFASPMQGAGLGIVGISERARILGGKHSFESAPGAGTTIIITLGLQNNNGSATDNY